MHSGTGTRGQVYIKAVSEVPGVLPGRAKNPRLRHLLRGDRARPRRKAISRLKLLVAASAVLSVLAACGQGATEDAPVGETLIAVQSSLPTPPSPGDPVPPSPGVQSPRATPQQTPAAEGRDATARASAGNARRAPGGRGGGFVPLDNPVFMPAIEASHLGDDDLVLGYEFRGEARAYPLDMMRFHHIANDTVAGTPVLITY